MSGRGAPGVPRDFYSSGGGKGNPKARLAKCRSYSGNSPPPRGFLASSCSEVQEIVRRRSGKDPATWVPRSPDPLRARLLLKATASRFSPLTSWCYREWAGISGNKSWSSFSWGSGRDFPGKKPSRSPDPPFAVPGASLHFAKRGWDPRPCLLCLGAELAL